ncbi:MAG: adenylosuccinate synthase [Anaerolineae bacterium]
MPATAIVGAQWGDEGKGKITDRLAAEADVVARYQGGDNAGHTVVHAGRILKLHQVPSGILHAGTLCVLGGGMVINPRTLLQEIDELRESGAFAAQLLISNRAHLIMPYHILLDGASENGAGAGFIGTTRKGIGPAYSDKADRHGLRVYDMMLGDAAFAEKVRQGVLRKNIVLERIYGLAGLDADAVAEEFIQYAIRLRPYVGDDSIALNRALAAGKQVLLEGAQGVLLDLDHGTYPYVTSSSIVLGGAIGYLGIPAREVTRVVGAAKAYQTRVGEGPFPTEQTGELGDRMRGTGKNIWDEFGTTTGRPRRCGWLDLVSVRYTARVAGITELAITKLDVLSGFDRLKVCVAYQVDGETLESFVPQVETLARVTPVYEEVPGWQESIREARRFEDLPTSARDYINFIEKATRLPVGTVTVGPDREQTIER